MKRFAKHFSIRQHTYYTKENLIYNTANCPLYDLLSPLPLSVPFEPSTALYPPPPWPPTPITARFLYSTTLCLTSGPLSPLRLPVPSTALCPLYSPLSTLRPLCPLCRPLSPLRLSASSTALCHLYGPSSPLWSFFPAMALCPL